MSALRTTCVLLLFAIPPLTRAAPEFETGARIPLEDGVELAADVLRPGPDRYPTVLEITPYGRGPQGINFRGEAAFWAAHGYAFVVVDARGAGDSDGRFDFFVNAAADGREVVDWIAAQPFSDGRVVMRGASYTGTNQLLVAGLGTPALRCLAPAATGGISPVDDVVYYDGEFHFAWAVGWPSNVAGSPLPRRPRDWDALLALGSPAEADVAAHGRTSDLYRSFLRHGPEDPHWAPATLGAEARARITQPVLMMTGWFDGTLDGTLEQFAALRASNPDAHDLHLVIGPWLHEAVADGGLDFLSGYAPMTRVGNRTLPEAAFLDGRDLVRRFFDGCLGRDEGPVLPPVRVWLTGSDRWVDLDHWPPRTTDRVLHLRSSDGANGLAGDGVLAERSGDGRDRFRHDPAHPVRTGSTDAAGRFRQFALYPEDLSPLIDREDVLVFTSAPFEAPVTIAGRMVLDVAVTSTAPAALLAAYVEEIDAAGVATKLGGRGPALARVTPAAGAATTARIEFSPVGHTLAPGHRLRLSIAGSAYPLTYPLPEAGEHTVFHAGSRLRLPVLETP